MLTDEFGPWIDHGGRGRPVPRGTIVEVEAKCLTGLVKVKLSTAYGDAGTAWDWGSVSLDQPWRIIRYRIRKPKGMGVIESILADLPESVPA